MDFSQIKRKEYVLEPDKETIGLLTHVRTLQLILSKVLYNIAHLDVPTMVNADEILATPSLEKTTRSCTKEEFVKMAYNLEMYADVLTRGMSSIARAMDTKELDDTNRTPMIFIDYIIDGKDAEAKK